MIALSVVLALAGPVDASKAVRDAAAILGERRYAFCHDPAYNLTEDEAAFCPPVAPRPNDRCPRWHEACEAPRAELDLDIPLRLQQSRRAGEGGPRGEREDAGGDAKQPGKREGKGDAERLEPRRRVDREEPVLPELGGLGELLFWVILIAGVVAIVLAILRNSYGRRRDDEPEDARPASEALSPGPSRADDGQVARDVATMLERARAAAASGDYPAAIKAAHAALLYRLDRDGLIRVEASRTNGDYLRDLRDRPDLRVEVRDVVRDVEQVQFGSAPATAPLFERIFGKAAAIATRGGGAALLLALLVGCPIGQPAPWDDSPSGSGAVIALAAKHEIAARFRARPLDELDVDAEDGPRTLVLMHDVADPGPEVWDRLIEWTYAGGHLIVAGGPLPASLDLRYVAADVGPALSFAPDVTGFAGLAASDELRFVSPDRRALAGDDLDDDALIVREGGSVYAAQRTRGRGLVTVLADDRLLTNAGLTVADNPALTLALLAAGEGRVELVDGLLDWGADNPAETIRQLKLTPVILQLLLLALVFFAWRGVRFGRPRDPAGRSRRRFAEHVEALGLQYARARAAHHAARQYASWALERLRDRAPGGAAGLYGVAQAIATRTGDDETRVYQILVEASTLRDDKSDGGPPGDLKLMQELARLVRAAGGQQ